MLLCVTSNETLLARKCSQSIKNQQFKSPLRLSFIIHLCLSSRTILFQSNSAKTWLTNLSAKLPFTSVDEGLDSLPITYHTLQTAEIVECQA